MEKKSQEYGSVRKPAVSGMFYPSEPQELRKMAQKFISQAKPRKFKGKLKAIVSPHAGYIYSGQVAGAAYSLVKGLGQKNEWKVVVLGPSHFVPFAGAANSGADFWETPLGKIKTEEKGFEKYPDAHRKEHSIEVQMPFLQCVLEKFTINPIVFGDIWHEELAEKIIHLLDGDTIIVASSDLSHYYPYDEAVELDSAANTAIPKLDTETAAGIEACGLTGILAVMHIAKKLGWRGEFVDYKNSGDTAGDKDSVVGYGAYAFYK